MSFSESYLGRLREKIGADLVLVPGVRCVLLDVSGRVLLQLRSDFRVWGIPSGNSEPGESLHATAIREMKEELGLVVHSLQAFAFASDPRYESLKYHNGHKCQHFALHLWSNIGQQEAYVVSDESIEVAWFNWNALPDDMLPNMRRSLEAFERFRTTNKFQII